MYEPVNADRTGLSGASKAIQKRLDTIEPGNRLVLSAGVYKLDAPLVCIGKRVDLLSDGLVRFVQAYADREPMLSYVHASGSVVAIKEFIGLDCAERYCRDYDIGLSLFATGAYRQAALRILDSEDVLVVDASIKNKIVGIEIDTSFNCKIVRPNIAGFGQAILDGGRPANWHIGINILQGGNHKIIGLMTDNVGNSIVTGSYRPDTHDIVFPADIEITDSYLRNARDNAIYISHGHRIRIVRPDIDVVNSSALRIQGDNCVVEGGLIRRASNGIDISPAYRDAVVESRWGGGGTSVFGTTVLNCLSVGVKIGDQTQSGVFGRFYSLDSILISGGCGTAAVDGQMEHSVISNVKILDGSGRGIRLGHRSSPGLMRRNVLNGVRIDNMKTIALQMYGQESAEISNIRVIRSVALTGNPFFFHLNNCSNCKIANIAGTEGYIVEAANCKFNSITNVRGAFAGNINGHDEGGSKSYGRIDSHSKR